MFPKHSLACLIVNFEYIYSFLLLSWPCLNIVFKHGDGDDDKGLRALNKTKRKLKRKIMENHVNEDLHQIRI